MSTMMSNSFLSNTLTARLGLSLLALGAAFGIVPSVAKADVPTPLDSSYVLTFDDEFNGTTLNTTTNTHSTPPYGWNVFTNAGAGGYESGYWNSSNPSVATGSLALPVTHPSGGAPYTGTPYQFAGVLTNYVQLHGYWEARVKLPASVDSSGNNIASGIWPAFWLSDLNNDNLQHNLAEIDVMEWLGYQPTIEYMTLHSSSSPNVPATPGSYVSSAFPSGWHVLGMLWTSQAVTWYVDGIQRAQSSNPAVMAQLNIPLPAVLNNAVVNQTNGWGDPVKNATVFPSNFYVDYVHIYSNAPGATVAQPQTNYTGPGEDANYNVLTNGGFESGANWSGNYYGTVTTSQPQNGKYAAQLATGNAEQQTVYLQPNTTYTLYGYAKVTDIGDGVVIGVKDYGGTELNTPIRSLAYTKGSVTFTTGPTNTSALIYFYKGSGTGLAYGDDFSVEMGNPEASYDSRTNLVPNAGLETGANWATAYGSASVTTNQPQNGQYALQIVGSGGEEQTITGLKPNTNYVLSGYATVTGGDTAFIGVKSYNGSADNPVPITASSYTQAAAKAIVTFTTGPSNTTAIIYFSKYAGTGTAYGDDFCVEAAQ